MIGLTAVTCPMRDKKYGNSVVSKPVFQCFSKIDENQVILHFYIPTSKRNEVIKCVLYKLRCCIHVNGMSSVNKAEKSFVSGQLCNQKSYLWESVLTFFSLQLTT